jgi:hypothetical protein
VAVLAGAGGGAGMPFWLGAVGDGAGERVAVTVTAGAGGGAGMPFWLGAVGDGACEGGAVTVPAGWGEGGAGCRAARVAPANDVPARTAPARAIAAAPPAIASHSRGGPDGGGFARSGGSAARYAGNVRPS